jgi:hypothetical protein
MHRDFYAQKRKMWENPYHLKTRPASNLLVASHEGRSSEFWLCQSERMANRV